MNPAWDLSSSDSPRRKAQNAGSSEQTWAALAYSTPTRSSVRRSHSTISRTSTSARAAICAPPAENVVPAPIQETVRCRPIRIAVNWGNAHWWPRRGLQGRRGRRRRARAASRTKYRQRIGLAFKGIPGPAARENACWIRMNVRILQIQRSCASLPPSFAFDQFNHLVHVCRIDDRLTKPLRTRQPRHVGQGLHVGTGLIGRADQKKEESRRLAVQ